MHADLVLQAADTPAALARLRTFARSLGAQHERTLELHLAQPRYRPDLTRLAVQGDAVVGCGLISHRRWRLGAATLEVGRLDALWPPTDAPAQAHHTSLIGTCLHTLVEQGLPFAWAAGGEPLVQLGFAPFRLFAHTALAAQTEPATLPLRPATSADLDDLAALYAATYQDQPLTEVRGPADWRAWWAAGPRVLVQQDNRGRVVGYAVLTTESSHAGVQVEEAATADAGVARHLLAALAPLTLQLAPEHPLTRAALHFGGTLQVHAQPLHPAHVELAGIADLPAALEALAPEFERRLAHSRYHGWSGNLRIEIETERVTLAFAQGRATVIDGSRPADVRLRRINLAGLAHLCLGYRAPADLRATGDVDCDDAALGLLDALFPVVPSYG